LDHAQVLGRESFVDSIMERKKEALSPAQLQTLFRESRKLALEKYRKSAVLGSVGISRFRYLTELN